MKKYFQYLQHQRFLNYFSALKSKPFFYWPPLIHRALMLTGAVLFFLFLMHSFGSYEQIDSNKHQITTLSQTLQQQRNFIQFYHAQLSGVKINNSNHYFDLLNLSNFVGEVSQLSKQNNLEIKTIKPVPLQKTQQENIDLNMHSFQMSLVGEYQHLLQYMKEVAALPGVQISDFKMITEATGSHGNPLKLFVTLSLYEQKS